MKVSSRKVYAEVDHALMTAEVVRFYDFFGDKLVLTVVPDKQARLNWSKARLWAKCADPICLQLQLQLQLQL